MTKLVLTNNPGDDHLQGLRDTFPAVTFVVAPDTATQRRELPDADGIVGWPQREALSAARQLRWVHVLSAGIEGIARAPELIEMDGVILTNSRGAHAPAIADHCFAFVLALARSIPTILEDQRAKRWERVARAAEMRTLHGSVMGLLGLGNIGSEIAGRALGFGMELRGVDANPAARCPGVAEVWGLERLDDLLRVADIVAVALPITAQTRGMIGARELALMKPSTYLCVMSRGGIVDQEALADALQQGRLGGAGLDATEPEPLPPTSPLWASPNIIISPHCSYASQESWGRLERILYENIRRFAAGDTLLNLCDKRAGF